VADSLFILSDLHIGANDDFDIFKSATKLDLLKGFIEHVRRQTTSAELIINGDFVDFLQLKPWNDLSRTVALAKIQRIVKGSAEVFRSIGSVLADGRHRIKILLGNHDAEIAYPEVWATLRDAIAADAGDRLELFNTRVTYNAEINGVVVHVEHGNAGDPWNSINYQPLFNDAEIGTTNFAYPPGTKFVYETMNQFKEELKFVDLLKPEVPAVPLLLMALRPRLATKALPAATMKGLDSLVNSFLVKLRERISGPQFAAREGETGQPWVEDEMAKVYLRDEPEEARTAWAYADTEDMESFLGSSEPDTAGGEKVFGPRMDKIKRRLLSRALNSLERLAAAQQGENFFQANHPSNVVARDARKRLTGKVQVVVFGHTHEALKTEFPEGIYLNCGTWANLIKLPTGDAQSQFAWLDQLGDNSFERTSFPTYGKVEPGLRISLCSWTDAGERTLWKKVI
jgi:UDP-2,3-diacylglucosamine pyrophosphatase LpxH